MQEIIFNPEECRFTSADAYSLLLLWEEGCFFQRLFNQQIQFPESAPILALATIPYCALIEHDSIIFFQSKGGVNLPYEGERINAIRNRHKSLDSRIDIVQYTSEIDGLFSSLSAEFKNHKGLLGAFKNSIQPDIGIFYYKEMPIGANYSFARYLENELDKKNGITSELMKGLGYQIGVSASFLYSFAEKLFPGQADLSGLEFETRSNDLDIQELSGRIKKIGGGCYSLSVLHLCSELMFQINTILALLDAKIITRRLWIKFMVVCIYHGCKSIGAFLGCVRNPNCEITISDQLATELQNIFPRHMRKRIEKMKDLRNALVHYDFPEALLENLPTDAHADYIPIEMIKRTLGMELEEFDSFLQCIALHASKSVSSILNFPCFDIIKEPK